MRNRFPASNAATPVNSQNSWRCTWKSTPQKLTHKSKKVLMANIMLHALHYLFLLTIYIYNIPLRNWCPCLFAFSPFQATLQSRCHRTWEIALVTFVGPLSTVSSNGSWNCLVEGSSERSHSCICNVSLQCLLSSIRLYFKTQWTIVTKLIVCKETWP